MKNFNLKQIAIAFLVMLLAASCIDDDEPTPAQYTAYGFINKIADTYYVNIDGGLKVELRPFDDSKIEFKGNDRILFQFTVEEEYDASAPVRYLVNVQSLMLVDYSQIVILNDLSRDTIGNGIVSLEYTPAPIDKYLNLSLLYQKQEGDHVFSLCYDETVQVEGKPVILELRNKRPEPKESGQTYRTYQSFNLSQLQYLDEFDNDGKMKFTLRINSGDSQETNFDLVYEPIP